MQFSSAWFRHLLLIVPLSGLAGCASPAPLAAGVAAEAASVAVFGRGMADIVVSAISGRDCSVVRLDRGQTYCASADPPAPDRFCTRSLAAPDCWDTAVVPALARPGIGDTPDPTPAQVNYRGARWPKSLTYE